MGDYIWNEFANIIKGMDNKMRTKIFKVVLFILILALFSIVAGLLGLPAIALLLLYPLAYLIYHTANNYNTLIEEAKLNKALKNQDIKIGRLDNVEKQHITLKESFSIFFKSIKVTFVTWRTMIKQALFPKTNIFRVFNSDFINFLQKQDGVSALSRSVTTSIYYLKMIFNYTISVVLLIPLSIYSSFIYLYRACVIGNKQYTHLIIPAVESINVVDNVNRNNYKLYMRVTFVKKNLSSHNSAIYLSYGCFNQDNQFIIYDEKLNNFLDKHKIKFAFDLSRGSEDVVGILNLIGAVYQSFSRESRNGVVYKDFQSESASLIQKIKKISAIEFMNITSAHECSKDSFLSNVINKNNGIALEALEFKGNKRFVPSRSGTNDASYAQDTFYKESPIAQLAITQHISIVNNMQRQDHYGNSVQEPVCHDIRSELCTPKTGSSRS